MSIAHRLDAVRAGVQRACRDAGRAPEAVTLVAVSKRKPVADIRLALAHDQLDFGENYAQELRDKHRELTEAPEPRAPRWHYIGPLQRNKVKYVVGTAALIHTVSSIRLLEAIDARAASVSTQQDVLVQVNLAEEPQKSGAHRDELDALLGAFATTRATRCCGLMLMPPYDPDPEASRPLFAELRALRDTLAASPRPRVSLTHLSMGMSHDFAVAIAEGATLVRVGTAIFGERS